MELGKKITTSAHRLHHLFYLAAVNWLILGESEHWHGCLMYIELVFIIIKMWIIGGAFYQKSNFLINEGKALKRKQEHMITNGF